MCGRYVFVSEPRELKSDFPDLEIISQSQPKTNISPGQDISVVRKKKTHILSSMRWGLIPSWAKDHAGTFKTFNARSETITEKPTFRTPFKKKRCLIPFNGFYEWKTEGKKKTPHYFFSPTSDILYFAGLYDEWEGHNGYLESCTVITTSANSLLSELHDRMPVILNPSLWDVWLSEKTNEKELLGLLQPAPPDLLNKIMVSEVREGVLPVVS